MKKWVASMMNDPESEIAFQLISYEEDLLTTYESMQPYKEGVIVSYTQPVPIEAQGNGLVIFTGLLDKQGRR